ncbi:hypothetical protein ACFL5E_01950 [Candidatus Omnitrophota bacterium]
MTDNDFGKLQYTTEITLERVPKQWMPRFELYYPDLPQFPIVYVHLLADDTRIYGFPTTVSFDIINEKEYNARLVFLCNVDLEQNSRLKDLVTSELGERFGLKDKVGLDDIVASCQGNTQYETFFRDLWSYLAPAFGDYLPYGKFYEEVYSMVRFVSAWQPKTGRQSEMRMLYNFLSIFGKPIEIVPEWNYLEFFLLPTYDDILNGTLNSFSEFQELHTAMEKVWDHCFTEETELDGHIIKSMPRSWPQNKDSFIKDVASPLCSDGVITETQKHALERLVDAFNRHSWRAAFFLWSIMNIKMDDYRKWDKDYFVKFYLSNTGVGISPKVIACFLQQGFKNADVIPLDTWIETFYKYPLGISKKEDFLTTFSNMGKLERAIWLSSQANKTNIRAFFDLLWCQRYGVTGNNELRGANPITCYECRLKNTCVGFAQITDSKVLIKEEQRIAITETTRGKFLASNTLTAEADQQGCSFICLTQGHIPKKVFTPQRNGTWKLIDEFSGYILHDQTTDKVNKVVTVSELLNSLPTFS